MGEFLSPNEVAGIETVKADELIGELETHLSLHYPVSSLDAAGKKKLKTLMIPIIRRWDDAGTGLVTQEITGPFTERKSGGGGHVLREHEVKNLRKLCGMDNGPARSRGSFPPAEPTADMFVRRPQWPTPGTVE